MTDAVESVPGTDPDRAAFTVALETARDQLIAADGIVPVPGRHDCGRIGRAILENLLPPRRPRTAPRKVKCPISRYANPPDQLHLPATARITAVSVAICRVQAPDGRRDRTLQLMRTDPHRPWHAREIAAGLGLPHHRGLTGELSRWVKEGIICKAAPGTFTLHADWIGPDNPAGHRIFDTKAPALTSRPWGTSSVPPWPCILPGIRASKIPGVVQGEATHISTCIPAAGSRISRSRTVCLGSLCRCIAVTCGLADLRVCWCADRERP
jgi:hypothetical protein